MAANQLSRAPKRKLQVQGASGKHAGRAAKQQKREPQAQLQAKGKGKPQQRGKQPRGGAPLGSFGRKGKRASVDPDADVYEAEDSDPDEVKNSKRYDEVENYEYEIPSDFEDEEIDEEMAFTEEDKKLYGHWFEKEVDADEDATDAADEEDVAAQLDSDNFDNEEEEDAKDDEPDEYDDEELDADDDLLFGSEDDEDLADDDEDDLEIALQDDERYRDMLQAALGGSAQAAAAARRKAAGPGSMRVVSEAYPESEHNLAPGAASAGAGELTIADLVAGLGGDSKRKLGAKRKLLDKVAGDKAKPVDTPLPPVVAQRVARQAGYEKTTEEVTKWQPIVKANREARTLVFTSEKHTLNRPTTTAALVANHKPETGMEAEVAALLKAAGAANDKAVAEPEEALALKELSVAEERERRERLAKMRSLLLHHEAKAKRLKAIKSKEYHRLLARADKRKAAKLAALAAEQEGSGVAGGGGALEADAAAARAAAIEAEFQRAKERLTLKHRNTSRWARRALKRGALHLDQGTKAAMDEQLRLGQELRKKIEGLDSGDEDEDGDETDASTSASDGEGSGSGEEAGGSGRAKKAKAATGSRTRAAAVDILSGMDDPEAPKKGLLALPFMQRALERRKQQAAVEAQQALQELEQLEARLAGGAGVSASDAAATADPFAAAAAGATSVVGYSLPADTTTAAAGRRQFGGNSGARGSAVAPEGTDFDGVVLGSDDDGGFMESDEDEDAQAKAERLAEQLKAQQQQQGPGKAKAGGGRQANKAQVAAGGIKGRPSAEELADLQAALQRNAGAGLMSMEELEVMTMDTTAGQGQGQEDRTDALAAAAAAIAARRASGPAAGVNVGTALDVARSHTRDHLFANGASAKGQSEAAVAAAAVAAAKAASQQQDGKQAVYIPSKTFAGAKPGYVFKKGPKGVGYYLDSKSPVAKKQQQQGKQPQQQQQTQQAQQQKQQQEAQPAAGKKGGDSDDDGDGDRAIMRPAPANRELQQKELVRMAFAGDDVEAEFEAEKAKAVEEEGPSIEEPSLLPGWGAWSAQQRNPKWMQDAKAKVAKQRADAAANRADAKMKYVVLSEKWDKKAAKYTTPTAPFPFNNPEVYERSIRQPLGRQYNPDSAFRDLTRPAVLKSTGVVIEPARFSEQVAKDVKQQLKPKNGKPAERPKVATVSGGMLRPVAKPKAATAK